ncbi:unnamed protein product [Cuscuta campestris]|uniref:Uncharacterized protein n=1 Tax=Cuscuta campestris TaxID=132261 RepID=A0A484N7E9_9ASTE|nr:unnamed protein product [Cuscuta campestris]
MTRGSYDVPFEKLMVPAPINLPVKATRLRPNPQTQTAPFSPVFHQFVFALRPSPFPYSLQSPDARRQVAGAAASPERPEVVAQPSAPSALRPQVLNRF